MGKTRTRKVRRVKTICLVRDCNQPVKARGLCTGCYNAAVARVRRKDATWSELEARGLASPLTHRGPSPTKFTKALDSDRSPKRRPVK